MLTKFPFWVMGGNNMAHILDFPDSGNVQSYPNGLTWDANSGTEHTLFNSPVGTSGIVRAINVIFQYTGGITESVLMKLILNIKYDGESTPSVSVPLASLVCYEEMDDRLADWYPIDGTPSGYVKQTRMVDHSLWSINHAVDFGDMTDFSCILKYPIPYTNGIHIYITNPSLDFPDQFWTNVYYQDSLPACWNRNYRFFATRTTGDNTYPSAGPGTVTIDSNNIATFSSYSCTPSDVGKYVGVSISEYLISEYLGPTQYRLGTKVDASTTNSTYRILTPTIWFERPAGKQGYLISANAVFEVFNLEADPVITANGRTDYDDIDLTGGEDFFFCAFYATTMQPLHDLGGVVCKGTNWNGYRNFHNMPKKYTNGIQGKVCNTAGGTVHNKWTTVYYEQVV